MAKRRTVLSEAKLAHKKAAFLRFYKKLGGKQLAANAIGVDRNSVWEWEVADPAFKKLVDAAEMADTEELVKIMEKRAKKKSDLLMMFALKKRDHGYRDSSKLELMGNVTVNVVSFADPKAKPKP